MNGMPTRVELQQRGVLDQNHGRSCVFCLREDEEVEHMFFTCVTASWVWQQINEWAGFEHKVYNGRWDHFMLHPVNIVHKKKKKLMHMVWLAIIWTLWINRNQIIFRGGLSNVSKMVQQIKFLTWGQFTQRVDTKVNITLENWGGSSLDCLSVAGAS